MRRLIARPSTVLIEDGTPGGNVIVCLQTNLTDQHEYPTTLELSGLEDTNLIDVSDIEVDERNLLVGTTSPSGFPITVRATMEEDSVALPSLPAYPLPVPVIIATISGENMDTHVEALVEDDGYVSTILLVTDMGLYTRYSRTWIRLADVDLIDGLNSVVVGDEAVDVYDTADDAGQQVHMSGMPSEQRDYVGTGELFVAASASRTFDPNGDNVTAAGFDSNLHPRGHDGRFIEIGALMRIVDSGQRGHVEEIKHDENDPNNPMIKLKTNEGYSIFVKSSDIEQAPDKARLDEIDAPSAPSEADVTARLSQAQRQVDEDQAALDEIEQALEDLGHGGDERRKEALRQERSKAWSFLQNSTAALERLKTRGVTAAFMAPDTGVFNPDLPVIDTPEQLLAAVEHASANETLRWYVEKRAKALGVEVELPWL